MNTSDIATEIYQELDSPASLLVSTIIYWLNSNMGVLNLLLETNFVVSTVDNSIAPDMGQDEKAIFKQLYNRYYYNKLLNNVLSVSGYGSPGAIVAMTEGNRVIKLNSGTELAKSYQSVITNINAMLSILVQAYKMSFNTPLEVVIEDRPDFFLRQSIAGALPYNSDGCITPY